MKQVQITLDAKSMIIGFFACAALFLFSAFGSPSDQGHARYQSTSGDVGTVILDTHSGKFIYKEDLAVWSFGDFESVFNNARPVQRSKDK